MTYSDTQERIKHAYILKLIKQCVSEKSIVLNKYVLPYLRQEETLIAAKLGRKAIKEAS